MPDTVEDLGKLVKSKYPGTYDSMPDAEVGSKVKAKYPEAYGNYSDVETSTIGKIRNYLGTGDVNKKLNPDTVGEPPHLPPNLERAGMVMSLVDPAISIARNPGGIINLGKSLYEGIRAGGPKLAGGATLAAGGGLLETGAENLVGHPTSYGRYIATLPGLRMMSQGLKAGMQGFASKFSPAPMSGLLSDSTEVGPQFLKNPGGPISGYPTQGRFVPGQYDVPGPVKSPVEVGGSHIPDKVVDISKTEFPPEFKVNPDEISGKPTINRFNTNQYAAPVKSPPVEVGGAHIPDYKGYQISPEEFAKLTSNEPAAPRPVNSAKSEFMKGLWKTYKESQMPKVEPQPITAPPQGPPAVPQAVSEAPAAFTDTESTGLQIPQHESSKNIIVQKVSKFLRANNGGNGPEVADQIRAMTKEEQDQFFAQQGKLHSSDKSGNYTLTDPVTRERILNELDKTP